MKLTEIKKLTFCCVCKKGSESGFEIDFNKRFFSNIKICKSCALQFYKNLGKHFVPKGLKNINAQIKEVKKDF